MCRPSHERLGTRGVWGGRPRPPLLTLTFGLRDCISDSVPDQSQTQRRRAGAPAPHVHRGLKSLPMRPVFEWQIGSRALQLGKRTLIMGVVNVTPDSFSDGGVTFDSERAVEHALKLLQDGADII